MLQELLTAVGGVQLNLATGPNNGPPLLMLHGVLRRWQGFMPLIVPLSSYWQVHAVDHRGHGKSNSVDKAYRVIDYLIDTVQMVREQFHEPAVIYGHSLGAMVAAGVAAAAPDNVKAIVLEDPPFETMGSRFGQTTLHNYFAAIAKLLPTNETPQQLAKHLAQVRYLNSKTGETLGLGEQRDATTLRFMATCLTQLDPDVLAPIVQCRWLDGWDWKQELAKIKCPVLLFQADAGVGGMLTDFDANVARETINDCTLVKMPGVGHLMHWQRPGEIVNHTLTFLETV